MTAPLSDLIRRLTTLERRVGRVETVENPGIGARVYRSTDQTIANTTDTAISFDTERWDNGGLWDGGQPTRLTAPIAGWYALFGGIRWEANATGNRAIQVRINGTSTIAYHRQLAITGGETTLQAIATYYQLAAGDYAELIVRQTSGGNLLATRLADLSVEFAMHRLC